MRQIRKTMIEDIPELLQLFENGKKTQIATGNPNQWSIGYPGEALLLKDVESGSSYVMEENGEIIATFYLLHGEDPTYQVIEGMWLNCQPYVTIHRITSKYAKQGIGKECIEWVQQYYSNIKIDTHELNWPMRRLVEQLGFRYCGVIYLLNGDPRVAYQYCENEEVNV